MTATEQPDPRTRDVPDTAARYRRACDYLAAAMIYLQDNVLLAEPLAAEHLKPRLVGNWSGCPGVTLVYAGLNRLVRRTGQRTLLVTGPGHAAPAVHANLWLEGSHADVDPTLSRDFDGLRELVGRFSWPGGFPTQLSPQVPGVIHEGGELGHALPTAAGAALDDPDLLVACIVGDCEAETAPTAGSWQTTKFLDPATCGAVLPVLHLNNAKTAAPTVYGCMADEELVAYFHGQGWSPYIVDVTDAPDPDALLGDALDTAHTEISALQLRCRDGNRPDRPVWPMVVLRTPEGLGVPDRDTGGRPLRGSGRADQLPLDGVPVDPDGLALLEEWLRSYRPEELFDAEGRPQPDLLELPPQGELRLGAVPQANGGALRRELPLPPLERFAVDVPAPGGAAAEPTPVLGEWLTELMRATQDRRDFRIICPDELASNRLDAVLAATGRDFNWPAPPWTEHLAPDGRVMEVRSEHLCQGWLQGYLLTGRHGLFGCYEAFASVVDSMVNQHARFLKMSAEVPWREPVASLNYLLSSEGWRQEHNRYSHQGPAFLNNLLTHKATTSRIFLPPDANTLLVTMAECLSSTERINLVVAGRQAASQWLSLPAAVEHCAAGLGVWEWASTGREPDVVLGCAGNIPTVEVLAAAALLRERAPALAVRVVNVVDLLSLASRWHNPSGTRGDAFEACFPPGVPVVFGFHGYPSTVHELLHGREDHARFHVHGYLEEGATTTPFALLASNHMTRHDLAADAAQRTGVAWCDAIAEELLAERDELVAHAYRTGQDADAITGWTWQPEAAERPTPEAAQRPTPEAAEQQSASTGRAQH